MLLIVFFVIFQVLLEMLVVLQEVLVVLFKVLMLLGLHQQASHFKVHFFKKLPFPFHFMFVFLLYVCFFLCCMFWCVV
jgi:hypothetical protein